MTTLDFAANPVRESGLQSAATWLAAHESGQASWLLIDAALLESRRLDPVLARLAPGHSNAYAGSPLIAFGQYAPRLIACSPIEPEATRLLTRLTEIAAPATAISALRTPATVAARELQTTFAYMAQIHIEARQAPVHCRFADTRVLPGLLAALTAEQRAPLVRCIREWGWYDRRGNWTSTILPGVAESHGSLAASPLRLSIEQFRYIQAASEPDALFSILLEKTPEVVPDHQRGEFHASLVEFLQTATELQVLKAEDRLQFVMLSLTCGDGFHRHQELASTWSAIETRRATLSEQMKSWPDALWDVLQPRGAPA